jgi:hypothetical protein
MFAHRLEQEQFCDKYNINNKSVIILKIETHRSASNIPALSKSVFLINLILNSKEKNQRLSRNNHWTPKLIVLTLRSTSATVYLVGVKTCQYCDRIENAMVKSPTQMQHNPTTQSE